MNAENKKILPESDIVIIGAGPVGTLLAILLGKEGKRVTLVERWPTLYDRPRAVTMDHEVARILATFGIDCNDDPAIAYHEELYYWKTPIWKIYKLLIGKAYQALAGGSPIGLINPNLKLAC